MTTIEDDACIESLLNSDSPLIQLMVRRNVMHSVIMSDFAYDLVIGFNENDMKEMR